MGVTTTPYVDWYAKDRRQDWGTPLDLFEKWHRRWQFDLDGAGDEHTGLPGVEASSAEHPIAWEGRRVFCNPPWSDIPPFIELAAQAAVAVLLVPARPNARWFHRALALGARVEFFLGRPKFRANGGKAAIANSPVDCLLLVFEKR